MGLKEMRQMHGLTQRTLAQAAGLSQSFIAELESGVRKPSFATLEKLAGALGVQVSTTANLFITEGETEVGETAAE